MAILKQASGEARQEAVAPSEPAGAASGPVPRHIAVIMDGNGRWAQRRGLARSRGHYHGVESVRRIVRAAAGLGVEFLTLYAFSSENWLRPAGEVRELLGLMRRFIRQDLADLHRQNVRVRVIGRRDDLKGDIRALIEESERLTRDNSGMTLVVAFNYGARNEIVDAVRRIGERVAAGALAPGEISAGLIEQHLDTAGIPDPDLVVRTSGEHRLSNFLLWQCAYAELVFVDALWPDFTAETLRAAIAEYNARERRFGGLAAGVGAGG